MTTPRHLHRTLLLLAALLGPASAATAHEGHVVDTSSTLPSDDQATGALPGFLGNLDGMSLLDRHGRAFDARELAGRTVLFNFMYTSCDAVCPLQTRALAEIRRALPAAVRERVRFVSLSLDPDTDTPARLSDFAHRMDAEDDGWHFLTGDVRELQRLAERLHLTDERASGNAAPLVHRSSLWLVDGRGRMLQRYRGDPPDAARLVRELGQVVRLAS